MRTSLISLIEQEEIQWETRAENWPSKEKNFIILLLQLTIAAHKNCKIRVKMKQNKKLCEKAEGIYKLEWRKNVSQQIQNWVGWRMWKTLVFRKGIQFEFETLKDIQVKQGKYNYKILGEVRYDRIKQDTFVIEWNEVIVEHPTRRFIRHLFNAYYTAKWQSQSRTIAWDTRKEEVNWQSFFNYINYKCSPTVRNTNPKYSKLKAFKIKLLMEELPTQEVKYNRNKEGKETSECPLGCKGSDSNYHMIVCSKNKVSLRKIITEEVKKTLEKHGILTTNVMYNIIRTMTNSLGITDPETKLTRVTLGMVNKRETKEINKLYKTKKPQESITVKLLHKIAKAIYVRIWKKRNEKLNNTKGHTNKRKHGKEKREVKEKKKKNAGTQKTMVAGNISEKHCRETTERNTIIKMEKWKNLFVQYNCTPQYINSIID